MYSYRYKWKLHNIFPTRSVDWNKLDFGSIDQEFRDRFERPVAEFFRQKTKAEIIREAIKRGIPLFPSNTAAELVKDEQLASRGYWTEVEHPELGTTITYPGAFFQASETSWRMERRAPLIGEHNEEIYINELGFSRNDLLILKQNNTI